MKTAGGMTALLLLAVSLGLGACGGSNKQAEAPEAPEPEEAAEEDRLIPAETLDAIRSFFERKNRVVSRCFTDALTAGEISQKTTQVRITLHLTITPEGRPTRLSFTDANVSSPTLEGCLRGHVTRWTLPTVPRPLDYSYTFGFTSL